MASHIAAVMAHARHTTVHYEDLYRRLHRAPELSWEEHATAAIVADELRALTETRVLTGIGGTGVVAQLHNGLGKTVVLRAELDALPLREDTGLPYASSTSTAMHACGHDMHMVTLLSVVRALHASRDIWTGTLVAVFQPSEENGAGAQAMVDDGLYDPARHAVPRPDVVLAGHLMPLRAGQLRTKPKVVNAAARSLRVVVHGKGGHGARPHTAIDPVVIASSIVLKLQTIVSRETAPQDSVVVTVGSFHAGTKENIISDSAELKINLRALSTPALEHTVAAVIRIVEGECSTFRCPQPPTIETLGGFPLLWNTPHFTQTVMDALRLRFGESFEEEESPSLGSEDLCNLVVPGAECCFWNVGCIPPAVWDRAEAEGRLHEIAGEPTRDSEDVFSCSHVFPL